MTSLSASQKNDFFLWAPQNASQMKVTFKIKWFCFVAQMVLEYLTKQRKFAFFAWNLQRFWLQRAIAKVTFAIVFCKNSLDAWSFSPERENSCRTQSRKSLLRLCSAIQIVADFTQKIILFCEAFWGAYKKKIILLCETLKGLLGGKKSNLWAASSTFAHSTHTNTRIFWGAHKKIWFLLWDAQLSLPWKIHNILRKKSMTGAECHYDKSWYNSLTDVTEIDYTLGLRLPTTLSNFAYRLHYSLVKQNSLTDYTLGFRTQNTRV